MKLGPTGTFSDGKINEDDEGDLVFAVGIDEKSGNVFVDFGHPLKWFAVPPELAIKIAMAILDGAKAAMERQK